MRRFLLIVLVTLVAAVLSSTFPPPSFANNEIRRYYDWSATLEGGKSQVLGAMTFGLLSSGATPSGTLQTLATFDKYLLGGTLTPDNFFYFLKPWQENILMTFTFDPKAKEKTRLAIAGERLEEMDKLAKLGKVDAMINSSTSYEKAMADTAANLEKLKEQKEEIADLLKLLEEETAKHTIVLERVIIAVPEEGRKGIERALEASWQGMDKVADLSNKPAVPGDLADRIAALKAQGLLTEEEAAKLIAAKTRGEARSELRKYMQEGVLPESDFMRLNENVKSLFPDDFYTLHELKRFYTLKRLEEEKPDEVTLSKIQEFAKNYKPGTIVPPDIRRYWGPIVQLEEIQNTLRPDLIDPNLFKKDSSDAKKFAEVIERYRPRPEDVAFVENFLAKNPDAANSLPPEYVRMRKLAEKFGAQCGPGYKWVQKIYGSVETGVVEGMCVPESEADKPLPEIERGDDSGRTCLQVVTSARSPGGYCKVFSNSCIPSGWTKVDSCTEAPGETPGKGRGPGVGRISCPSNSHFVPVYGPDSGYCIPNYTPIKDDEGEDEEGKEAVVPETACPNGYHRSYREGPCLPDYKSTSGTFNYFLPPLTTTPGGYPNPFYPPSSQCGPGSRWVPEPINPRGGYCEREGGGGGGIYPYPTSVTPIPGGDQSCPAGQYRGPGGYCIPTGGGPYPTGEKKDDYCKPPAAGCGANWYWDQGSCVCREENSYPTRCTYPAGGCGANRWFDFGSCSCKESSAGSGGPPLETRREEYQPPKGYGSCGSGQYWNGSSCVTPPKEEKPPEYKSPEYKQEYKPEYKPPEQRPPEYKPPENKPPEQKPPEEKHEEQKPPESKPLEQPPQSSGGGGEQRPPEGEMH